MATTQKAPPRRHLFLSAGGRYLIPPHSGAITLQHDAADATNPRNDLILAEVLDSVSDGGASNLARVRIVKGTPNASATREDALGVNGTPELPSSAIPLAVVNIDVGETTISAADIDDRRYRGSGVKVITTEETTTSTSFVALTTVDEIRNLVLPTDGLIHVGYRAVAKVSAGGLGVYTAGVFLNGTQVKEANSATALEGGGSNTAYDSVLVSQDDDFVVEASWAADVTTGQVAFNAPLVIEAAAGVYTVQIRWKANSTYTTSVKNRKLRAWAQAFPT